MASIRSVASKLLTTRSGAASGFRGLTSRSVIRPASGFLNTNNGVAHPLHAPGFANSRGYAVLSLYDGFIDRYKTARRKLNRLYTRMTYTTTRCVGPSWTYSNKEYLQFYVFMKVGPSMVDNILVYVDNHTIFIQGHASVEDVFDYAYNKYVCWIDLPDIDSSRKKYNISNIKAEMINGEIRVTVPRYKPEETTFNVKVDIIE